MSVPYNNLKKIVQTDEYVMINVEWMHWARIIRLDSKHRPDDIRSLSGDSIGRWEGDTLVVDTTNFIDMPGPAREKFHVVERFTPKGSDGLLYQFTVEDSDYTAPYSGEYLWPKTPDRLLRVRLPRRQLRDGQHPARRPVARAGGEEQEVGGVYRNQGIATNAFTMKAFARSTKNDPASVMSRNAFGEGP